jgi:hypothetical protein
MADKPSKPGGGKHHKPYRGILPGMDNPGDTNRKGYIAEPGPNPRVPKEGALPLVSDEEVTGHVTPENKPKLGEPGHSEAEH